MQLLGTFAPKYIWWQTADQAVAGNPAFVAAAVMDRGTFEDFRRLEDVLGVELLCLIVRNAEAGWFQPASWHFWHYRLGLADTADEKTVPPLPVRRIPK